MTPLYPLVADLVLVLHGAFIAFVVAGELGVVVGHWRGWRWVRNRAFRVCHVLAIGIVVALAWANAICPLTAWENALRRAAGEPAYAETFVQHWVSRLIYWDGPQWVFTVVYSLFGALVLASWIWVRPETKQPRARAGGSLSHGPGAGRSS